MKTLTEEQKKAIEQYNLLVSQRESFKLEGIDLRMNQQKIGMLQQIFGLELFVEQKDIRERVKSWEDALKEVQKTDFYKSFHGFLYNLQDFSNSGNKYIKSVYAYCKLLVIVEALNEGWKPNYKDNSEKHQIGYSLYDSEENWGFKIEFMSCYKNNSIILKSEDLAQHLIDNFSDLLKDYFMID